MTEPRPLRKGDLCVGVRTEKGTIGAFFNPVIELKDLKAAVALVLREGKESLDENNYERFFCIIDNAFGEVLLDKQDRGAQ